MIGRKLSHFRLGEELGSGSMGVVYRARDEELGRDVAIKILPTALTSDPSARGRLRKEAHALSKLSHENIETIFDFGTSEDGIDFLVMELLEGKTLARQLEDGPLPEELVLELGIQLLSAIEAAHEQGIAHRDLKPTNICILKSGRLKVLDFGLAKWVSPDTGQTTANLASSTDTNIAIGTVPYMSPEQLRGNVDERCDLFGVGAVLYEMLTARRAFPQEHPAELIQAILNDPPPRPRALRPEVTPGLEAIVVRALEKRADERFRSAHEMRRALERVASGEPEPSRLRSLLRRIGLG